MQGPFIYVLPQLSCIQIQHILSMSSTLYSDPGETVSQDASSREHVDQLAALVASHGQGRTSSHIQTLHAVGEDRTTDQENSSDDAHIIATPPPTVIIRDRCFLQQLIIRSDIANLNLNDAAPSLPRHNSDRTISQTYHSDNPYTFDYPPRSDLSKYLWHCWLCLVTK